MTIPAETLSTTATTATPDAKTTAGNYFVANYPPFSFWRPERKDEALTALAQPPSPGTPLGVYLHLPFCRKRCHFCYFKVYTGRDAKNDRVRAYVEALLDELEIYARSPLIAGRRPRYVYFGGGTPSFLSPDELEHLFHGMKRLLPWDDVEEVTFECEPGTLNDEKLSTLRNLGVTRLSLGIENFDDEILRSNGRAHLSKEIHRAYQFARSIGFKQINIDLIAGMLNETEANWRECVRKAIALAADCVTVYQMEIPFNTTIYQQMHEQGQIVAPVADWPTKRAWVDYAFTELEAGGLHGDQRLHGRPRPADLPLPLPRLPLARRRHGGPGRLFLRPSPRHALPERKGHPALFRSPQAARAAHPTSPVHDRGREAGPRGDPANEARAPRSGLLPRKIRHRHPQPASHRPWTGSASPATSPSTPTGCLSPGRDCCGSTSFCRSFSFHTTNMHAIPEAPGANAGLSGGGGSTHESKESTAMYVPVLTCPKFLDLLAEFYSEMAAPLAIDAMMVVPEAIPQPQRSLLVHDHDMTSTLARFHGEPIELRVLDCKLSRDHYRRHIVLETAHSRRPAEYGAMRVSLPLLEEAAQTEVLQARGPLGGILTAHGITFRCCPGAISRFSPTP